MPFDGASFAYGAAAGLVPSAVANWLSAKLGPGWGVFIAIPSTVAVVVGLNAIMNAAWTPYLFAVAGLAGLFGAVVVAMREHARRTRGSVAGSPVPTAEPIARTSAALGIRMVDARWNRIHKHADIRLDLTSNAPDSIKVALLGAKARIHVNGVDLWLERVSTDPEVIVLPLPNWTMLEFRHPGPDLPPLNVDPKSTSARCEVRLYLEDRGELVCSGRVGLDGY